MVVFIGACAGQLGRPVNFPHKGESRATTRRRPPLAEPQKPKKAKNSCRLKRKLAEALKPADKSDERTTMQLRHHEKTGRKSDSSDEMEPADDSRRSSPANKQNRR